MCMRYAHACLHALACLYLHACVGTVRDEFLKSEYSVPSYRDA